MALPETMKALVVTEIGKPLSVTTKPVPTPGPEQILVRVAIAGPNPHDADARDTGLFIADILPAVLCNDVVGTVVARGSSVDTLAVGDRVLGQAGFTTPPNQQTGFQEYALLDAAFVVRIPDSLSDDEAATIPTNLTAAVFGLFDPDGLAFQAPWDKAGSTSASHANDTLLVVGGGSNCGRLAVQLSRLAGIGRIVVVGGDQVQLRGWGATHVLDRHGSHDEVLARIRAVVGDDLVRVLDAINHPEGQVLGVNALSRTERGKFARLLPAGPIDEANVLPKEKGWELIDVMALSHLKPDFATPYWRALPGLLAEGKIQPTAYTVAKGLDADKANEVLDAYRDGKKVVKTHFHLLE